MREPEDTSPAIQSGDESATLERTIPPLCRDVLSELDSRVSVPTYDLNSVTRGIAHIGVGGFHRSHQAVHVDNLLERGFARDCGIVGIGLMPQDRAMRDALRQQDYLYSVVVKCADGTIVPRVVGSIIDYLLADDDPDAVLEALADPAIRIVSLTITEGGYHADQVTGELVLDDALRADLAADARLRTAFGFIVEALARRRASGVPAFTVMSCDNIPGNGSLARRVITAYARLRDAELGEWIAAEVAFPNSMVDRITPMTTAADRQLLAERFGYQDIWPVVCESYSKWVLEDDFAAGRPPFETVDVQMVTDVTPYELMKLRLLNASHQALCYLGYLAGFRFTYEVCQDPLFVEFLLGYMEDEATATLSPVPGVDLDAYRRQLVDRFANRNVSDHLARLCADSSDRIPKFLLPVVHEQLRRGGEVQRSALVVAAWARYAEGVDEQGAPIPVVDQRRESILERASHNRTDPVAFLDDLSLFGALRDNELFVTLYSDALRSLHELGAYRTLKKWVEAWPRRTRPRRAWPRNTTVPGRHPGIERATATKRSGYRSNSPRNTVVSPWTPKLANPKFSRWRGTTAKSPS